VTAGVEYLTLDGLVLVCRRRGFAVRDVGLLDSAVGRPQASVFGEDAYPTLPLKAAALAHSIACNHALVDGNKRLAWIAAMIFLGLNGATVDLTEDDAFDLVMSVADGSEREVDKIAARLAVLPLAQPNRPG
jgi:death-on-curing protein